MKTNTVISPIWNKIPVAFCAAMALCLTTASPLFAEKQPESYTDKVSHARLAGVPPSWLGAVPPGEAESQELFAALGADSGKTFSEVVGGLESFVKAHPNSPWAPSLHRKLAEYYQRSGYATLALNHWQVAWEATKQMTDNRGRLVADCSLVNYLQLLSQRGSPPLMRDLFDETKDRAILPLFRQQYNQCRAAYDYTQKYPQLANRCGVYALNAVAKVLVPTNTFGLSLTKIPAPRTGFSLAQLAEMAESNHLDLVAVARPAGQDDLVVPSVVHENQDHYVAIVARQGDWYKVIDPAFRVDKWLNAKMINADASGQFLVSAKRIPAGWQSLSPNESTQVFGKCTPPFIPPPCCPDPSCPNYCGGPGNGNSGNNGSPNNNSNPSPFPNNGPKNNNSSASPIAGMSMNGVSQNHNRLATVVSCGNCGGMPTWLVREPWCDLCLVDEPLAYQPATGPRILFKLSYSGKYGSGLFNNYSIYNTFSIGNNWNCSWFSYITPNTVGGPYDSVTLYPPGGGERVYSNFDGTIPDPDTNTRMLAETTNGDIVGFKVLYPSGAQDIYERIWQQDIPLYFLTKQLDRGGRATTFIYTTTNDINNHSWLLLQYVVDADGKTNTLGYTEKNDGDNYWVFLVSQVTDPYGHTVTLSYNNFNVDQPFFPITVTNVVDVLGISSLFNYSSDDGALTNLVTPYGATGFSKLINEHDLPGLVVTEPNGSHQMFFYNTGEYGNIPAVYTDTNNVPTVRPPDNPLGTNTLDNPHWGTTNADGMNMCNTFYWGRQQFADLSTNFLLTAPAWDLNQLTTNDYAIARLKHWNMAAAGWQSDSLSMEREPSPDDGTTPGKMTWYDYPGKPDNYTVGTSRFPSLIIEVLPDGSEWYELYQVDQFGNRTNVISTYSVNGSVLTRTNSYVYSTNGVDLLGHIGPDGVLQEAYAYDANHQVLFMTNALGEETSYTYNNLEQPTGITQPSGLVTTNIYGSDGNLAQSVVIGFSTNSYTFTNALVYTHTDERGLTVTNSWDALERLTNVAYPDGTSISYIYSNLDLVQVIDRMGYTNSYGYNSIRQMISETDALGHTTGYSYCECGTLYAITNALGQVTYFIHDSQGNLIQTFYPDGYSVTNTYNSLRQLVVRTDSSGMGISNFYNNQGLLVAVTNNAGRLESTAYDVRDRVTNTVDANGVSMGMTYDNLNRPLMRSYPDGGVEHWVYTLNVSGPTSYTNQIANVVLYAYDTMNRKTNEVTVDVTTNSFAYDAAGDLLALTDGKNQTTAWIYDQYGRVTNKVDAASTLILAYKYDPDNRLTNRWSIAKGTTVYRYDLVGNLTNVDYSGGTSYTSPLYFSYDAVNRLTNMVDAVGTTVYGYDTVGQLLSEDGPWVNDTVSYTYTNRLRTGLSLEAPNASAWNQTYGYDSVRRLTNVTSPAGAFIYTLGGASAASPLIKKFLLPNGAYITNSYDSVARLLSTALKNSNNTVLDSESYAYNQANRRTAETNTSGDYRNYTYDNMGELLTAIGKEPGGTTNRLHEQFGYAYDAAGNLNYRTNNTLLQAFAVNNLNELSNVTSGGRLTVVGTTTSPATNVTVNTSNAFLYADATFASTNQPWANGNNTYTAIAKDSYGRVDTNSVAVKLSGTNSYSYDLNGNLLSDGTRNFAYDDENQLVSVWTANTWSNNFAYDGKLRRRIERDYTWSSGSWILASETHFVYDGNLVIQERDGGNNPLVTYTRGNDLSGTMQGAGGIGGLLARTDMGQWIIGSPTAHAYYHTDGNGNIMAMVNSSQAIVAKYLYDPFGNTLSLSGSLASANKYRFSSKEWNDNTGLYYYLYRFYDPNLQRWPNRDPLGEDGFEALHRLRAKMARWWNGNADLYSFVGNNPNTSVDRLGLDIIIVPVPVPGSPFNPIPVPVDCPSPTPTPPPRPPNPCSGLGNTLAGQRDDRWVLNCKLCCDHLYGGNQLGDEACYDDCDFGQLPAIHPRPPVIP